MSTMPAHLCDLTCCSKANEQRTSSKGLLPCGALMCAWIHHMQQPMTLHRIRLGCITCRQACSVLPQCVTDTSLCFSLGLPCPMSQAGRSTYSTCQGGWPLPAWA